MKKHFPALCALTLLIAGHLQAQWPVDTFDDVQFWVGSGSKRSALVLQWNDGRAPSSIVWGFRWDGEVTGIQMLIAIAGSTIIREPYGGDVLETLSGADSRITLVLERYGFGDAIYSLVYREAGSERTASDWSAGFWQYSVFAGQFDYSTYNAETEQFDGPFAYNRSGSPRYSFVDWFESQIGASDRLLVDGSWDAWSFAPGFATSPVDQPTSAGLPLPDVTVMMLGSQPVIRWSSVGGFYYRVQYAGAPNGPWNDTGVTRAGTGEVLEFVDSSSPRPLQRFYRVVVFM